MARARGARFVRVFRNWLEPVVGRSGTLAAAALEDVAALLGYDGVVEYLDECKWAPDKVRARIAAVAR